MADPENLVAQKKNTNSEAYNNAIIDEVLKEIEDLGLAEENAKEEVEKELGLAEEKDKEEEEEEDEVLEEKH